MYYLKSIIKSLSMKKNQNNLDYLQQIKAYLNNNMGIDERRSFEIRLKEDALLRSEMMLDLSLRKYYIAAEKKMLAALIKELEDQEKVKSDEPKDIIQLNSKEQFLNQFGFDERKFITRYLDEISQHAPKKDKMRNMAFKTAMAPYQVISPQDSQLYYDQIALQFEDKPHETAFIRIYNDKGELISKFKTKNIQQDIEVHDLKSGKYYITIVLEEYPVTRSFFYCKRADIPAIIERKYGKE